MSEPELITRREFSRLESQVDSVHSNVQGIERSVAAVERQLSSLKQEVDSLSSDFGNLLNSINSSFKRFEESLGGLTDVTRKGYESLSEKTEAVASRVTEVTEKTETVATKIDDSKKVTREGLEKVSGGVAVVDALKARQTSTESTIAIERWIKELDERYEAAQLAVNEKRQLFRIHFSETIDSFQKGMRVIADHISELIARDFDDLDTVVPNLESDQEVSEVHFTVQNQHMAQRQVILQESRERLDLDALTRFVELRQKLDQFVHEGGALQHKTKEKVQLAPMYLPANLVLQSGPDGERQLDIYGLEMSSASCREPGMPRQEYAEIYRNMQESYHEARSARDIWSQDQLDGLKKGLKNLEAAGLLGAEDCGLIIKHLDTHRLQHVDSMAPMNGQEGHHGHQR